MHRAVTFIATALLGVSLLAPVGEARPALMKQSSLDALRASIQSHWLLSSGLKDAVGLSADITLHLDRGGNIVGRPAVRLRGGTAVQRRNLLQTVSRAVVRSAPFTMLPADHYDAWKTVIVSFAIGRF